ncbi:MAG: hypothetical protein ACOVOR_04015 [Rhabdochlamydiaceae bacterium]
MSGLVIASLATVTYVVYRKNINSGEGAEADDESNLIHFQPSIFAITCMAEQIEELKLYAKSCVVFACDDRHLSTHYASKANLFVEKANELARNCCIDAEKIINSIGNKSEERAMLSKKLKEIVIGANNGAQEVNKLAKAVQASANQFLAETHKRVMPLVLAEIQKRVMALFLAETHKKVMAPD